MEKDSKEWLEKIIKNITSSEYYYKIQLWNSIENYLNKNYPSLQDEIGSVTNYNLLKLDVFRNIDARIFYSGRYFFEEEENYFMFVTLRPTVPYFDNKDVRLNEQKIKHAIQEIAAIPVFLSVNREAPHKISEPLRKATDVLAKKYIEATTDLRNYRNQKGKEWREELYKLARQSMNVIPIPIKPKH